MSKRVLIFCLGFFLLGFLSVSAQEAEFQQGLEAYQGEEYDRAESLFNAALNNKAKNSDEIYYWIGMSYYRRDAFAQAKEYFQQGLGEKSRSAINHAGMGLMYMIEQQYAPANEALEAAMDYSRGKDLGVLFAVGEAYIKGGPAEIKKAKQILYPLKSDYPDNPRAYIALGTYYKETGVPSLAIEELEKAITLVPDYAPIYVMLAELYYDQGKESNSGADFEKAFEYANQAIDLDSEFPPSYRTRAEVYLLLKQYDKARDDMEKYVSLTDGDLRAELRYASFLFLTEDYGQAIDRLNDIDTTTQLKRRLLGIANYELGNLEAAKAAMDDYFANTQKEEYIIWQDYKTYGDIFRAMGDLKTADENYVKMITKNDEQSGYFEDLADDYETEAKKVKAEAQQMRNDGRTAQKEANEYYKAYQTIANMDASELTQELSDKAAEYKEKMDAAVEKGKQLLAARAEKLKEATPFYELESHYRQMVVDYQPAESLQNYYKLAKASYNAEQFDVAEPNFKKVIELKSDYAPPYNYWLQIANKRESADTTSMSWYVLEPAEAIIGEFGEKDPAAMSKSEKRMVIAAYEILAGNKFSPTGSNDPADLNCEAAMPYVDGLKAVDPNYSSGFINSLVEFCNQR